MNINRIVMSFCLIAGWAFGLMPSLFAHPEDVSLSTRPIQHVTAIGAPTVGGLIEGIAGAPYRAPHHRYCCRSDGPKPGFIGPDVAGKPTCVRDQPGVFPAPIMGPDSLSFTFRSQDSHLSQVTPVVVRPDGIAIVGRPMQSGDASQTLEVPFPAQMGIYTLFILPHENANQPVSASVEVQSSVVEKRPRIIPLQSFVSGGGDLDLICGEYIYLRNK